MASAPARRFLVIPLVLLIGALLAWAGSSGGERIGGWPVFAIAVAIAFLVQWLAFVPVWLLKTERHFD